MTPPDEPKRPFKPRPPRTGGTRSPRPDGPRPPWKPRPGGPPRPGPGGPRDTSWQKASGWYDKSVGEEGNFYHQTVVIPGLLRLLRLGETERVKLLDLACGQGVLARSLPATVEYWGVDLSQDLLASARKLDQKSTHRYVHGDACGELPFAETAFSHAACMLALQNVESPERLMKNAAARLVPGGRFVMALNHPCFRIPKQTSWVRDDVNRIQYRRVDRYLSRQRIAIRMNPSMGSASPETWTFHAPLSDIFAWLHSAGLFVDGLEEWVSNKRSVGPAALMENRARAEFPLFLGLSAVKR